MSTAKVYAKGQITLPKSARAAIGIRPGDSVVIETDRESLIIKKQRGVLEASSLSPRRRRDWKQIEKAVRSERARRRT